MPISDVVIDIRSLEIPGCEPASIPTPRHELTTCVRAVSMTVVVGQPIDREALLS